MSLFANFLSFLSISTGYKNSKYTVVAIFAEPECPKELL